MSYITNKYLKYILKNQAYSLKYNDEEQQTFHALKFSSRTGLQ